MFDLPWETRTWRFPQLFLVHVLRFHAFLGRDTSYISQLSIVVNFL